MVIGLRVVADTVKDPRYAAPQGPHPRGINLPHIESRHLGCGGAEELPESIQTRNAVGFAGLRNDTQKKKHGADDRPSLKTTFCVRCDRRVRAALPATNTITTLKYIAYVRDLPQGQLEDLAENHRHPAVRPRLTKAERIRASRVRGSCSGRCPERVPRSLVFLPGPHGSPALSGEVESCRLSKPNLPPWKLPGPLPRNDLCPRASGATLADATSNR